MLPTHVCVFHCVSFFSCTFLRSSLLVQVILLTNDNRISEISIILKRFSIMWLLISFFWIHFIFVSKIVMNGIRDLILILSALRAIFQNWLLEQDNKSGEVSLLNYRIICINTHISFHLGNQSISRPMICVCPSGHFWLSSSNSVLVTSYWLTVSPFPSVMISPITVQLFLLLSTWEHYFTRHIYESEYGYTET